MAYTTESPFCHTYDLADESATRCPSPSSSPPLPNRPSVHTRFINSSDVTCVSPRTPESIFDSEGTLTPTEASPLLSKARLARKASISPSFSSDSIDGDEHDCPRKPTPIPWKQLSILLVGQIPEAVVASVLYPFINQLISELDVTGGDEKKVGYYAGFIESLFFLSEFCMVLRWGRLSDRIGRKPVILCGLLGTMVSSTLFGLSRSYLALVVSRSMAGLLSGNIGVMKSAIGEITDETNVAEGFALLPVVWSAGSTMGPLIGGFLSQPQQKFPRLFRGEFWATYPYFLPCAAAALICLLAATVVGLFFEESLPALRKEKTLDDKERQPLIPSRIACQRTSSQETLVETEPSIYQILTPPVVVAIANYGALALIDIAYTAIIPLFYSTPIEAGGLGFSTSQIGSALGTLGLVNGTFQGIFSARIQRTFGVKNVYLFGLFCYFGLFATFPIMNYFARIGGHEWMIYSIMFSQLIMTLCVNMSFGCIYLFITAASERSRLGATNGISQTVASLMRMIGPAAGTSLFAVTMENNLMSGQFVYWILSMIVCVSLVVAIPLPKRVMGIL